MQIRKQVNGVFVKSWCSLNPKRPSEESDKGPSKFNLPEGDRISYLKKNKV